jgi:hypothetical protein
MYRRAFGRVPAAALLSFNFFNLALLPGSLRLALPGEFCLESDRADR